MTREPTSGANRYADALARSGGEVPVLESTPEPVPKPKRYRIRVEPVSDPWGGKPTARNEVLDILERVELEAYRAQEKQRNRR